MATTSRSILLIAVLAVVLAACSTAAAPPVSPTPTPEPSPIPTSTPEPSEEPSEPPSDDLFVHGTLDYLEGVAIDGPGTNLRTALLTSDGVPLLVNGAFVRDVDGSMYLCESIDLSAPALCGGLNLEVVHYDAPATWDLANADVTGLKEADGILYYEGTQLYGAVTARP